MKMKSILVVLVAVFVLFGCAGKDENKLESIKISGKAALNYNETTTFTAILKYTNGDKNETVNWSVVPAEAGTINNGVFTALKSGTADIIAEKNGVNTKYSIIIDIGLKSIVVTGAAIVETGKSATYAAIITYSDGTVKEETGILGKNGVGVITTESGIFYSDTEGETIIKAEKNNLSSTLVVRVIKRVPDELRGELWKNHFVNDILPFWMMKEAKGEPLGNFPTYRQMDGKNVDTNKTTDVRYPRMIGRQIYTYSMGYLLTGDEELLKLAKAGVEWLSTKARDAENGGYYPMITAEGYPVTEENLIEFGKANKIPDPNWYKSFYFKSAQDLAYCNLGYAAYYFVTRDKEAEKYLLETKDLLFNKKYFYDESTKLIKDALSVDMKTTIDQEGGGAELVALLDQINAYMLLTQPVLSDENRRTEFLNDMKSVSDTMIATFYKDGIFWGQKNNIGKFGTRHVDFGHTLKSYWMLEQLDKRLNGHPYENLVNQNAPAMVNLAYDSTYGRWGKKMTALNKAEYGSDWWIYAEADQFVASMNMGEGKYSDMLKNTSNHWITDFVDKQYKEVYAGINRDGTKSWNWATTDTGKQNEWKNGFHSTEHALVMYITGKNMEKKDVELYFAVEPDKVNTFIAKPYIYDGKEKERSIMESVSDGTKSLKKVKVKFSEVN